MTTTIAHNGSIFTPELVLGYSSTRQVNNLVHDLLGRSDPAVTFKAAGLRRGTLQVLCSTHGDALKIEALHADIGFFTLTDDDLPGLNMRYVPNDSVDLELDDDTREKWIVSVGFQEVTSG